MTPEEKARQKIDAMFKASGWDVQSKDAVNLSSARGIAVRELSFRTGEPDHTLFIDGKAIGTTEAKPEGDTLTGVEEQSTKYVFGLFQPEQLAWLNLIPSTSPPASASSRRIWTSHRSLSRRSPAKAETSAAAWARPTTFWRTTAQDIE